MKSVKFILAAAALFVGASASAQQHDYSDDAKFGMWGATVEERAANIEAQNLLKDAMDNKKYDEATIYFQQLLNNCPKASVNTFTRGVTLYRTKIQRSRSIQDKKMFIDSLMYVYDQRVVHFGDRTDKGKDYILDAKARDMAKFNAAEREALRNCLKEAIDASLEKGYIKHDLASMYFKNLCDAFDYDDAVTSDMIIYEYERLAPFFAEVTAENEQHKTVFENSFVTSSAVSCENLEVIFAEKIAANPDDAELLSKAVTLMSSKQCSSDFYYALLEKYYVLNPSADTALFLANVFKGRGDNDKALKYLRETLAVETNPASKEPLYAQIAIIEVTKQNYPAAAQAARELRAINPQNGYSYFVLAQCYASTTCPDDKIGGTSNFWAAYDAMNTATNLFKNEPEMQKLTVQLANQYKGNFPTQESCFFAELAEGSAYTVLCGYAQGVSTTVRYR